MPCGADLDVTGDGFTCASYDVWLGLHSRVRARLSSRSTMSSTSDDQGPGYARYVRGGDDVSHAPRPVPKPRCQPPISTPYITASPTAHPTPDPMYW